MLKNLFLMAPLLMLVSCQPRQGNDQLRGTPGLRPILLFIERLLDNQASNQQAKVALPSQQQQRQLYAPPSTEQQVPQPQQRLTQQSVEQQLPIPQQQLVVQQQQGQQLQQGKQQQLPNQRVQQRGQQQQLSPEQIQQLIALQYVRLLDPSRQQQLNNVTVQLPQVQFPTNYYHPSLNELPLLQLPQLQQNEPVQPILQPAQHPHPGVYQGNTQDTNGGIILGRQELFQDPHLAFSAGYPFLQQNPESNYVPDNQQQNVLRTPQFFVYQPRPGQPILINSGGVPGNFLPSAGVPGVVGVPGYSPGGAGRTPQFVSGPERGQPQRPSFVPSIEKDAEEVPTDPRKIPPFNGGKSTIQHQDIKPEKLETLDEGRPENPTRPNYGESDFNPQGIPHFAPRPGHKFFFILNGQTLLPHSSFKKYNGHSLAGESIPYGNANKEELQANIPQEHLRDGINSGRYTDGSLYNENKYFFISEEDPFSRSNVPSTANRQKEEFGQFKYTPPNEPYFPFGDESTSDSVVVDAEAEYTDSKGNSPAKFEENTASRNENSEPSTAQAEPGAVAIAGPGGMAGAAPKATALAGKGGLAVSSPHATAVAGTETTKRKRKGSKDGNK